MNKRILSYNKPEMPGKVTGKDLYDWSMENGEEVLVDGPWIYNESQEQKLCVKISDSIKSKYNITLNFNDLDDFFNHLFTPNTNLSQVDEKELHMD